MRVISTTLVVLLSGTCFGQSWIEYRNEVDLFTLNLPAPGEPQVTDITYPSEYGAVFPGRVYTLESGDSVYSVTVIDYTNSQQIHLARTNSTEADAPANYEYWRIDVIASIAYAATNYRNRGGEVTYDAWHHVDRVAGHQLNITNPDTTRSYVGIYLHDNRLYMAEARVPKGAPPQGHFQQSLGFINEEGKRLRYEYAEDGSLVQETR